ncbi:MAG TPA: hypothetical protein VK034_15280 [Enhygromyxa sp.]|nr:hypothetical protein [Enhygromyxa sp.]
MIDILIGLIALAFVTRGGPSPEVPPTAEPVEIVISTREAVDPDEECRRALATAPPGSTCRVEIVEPTAGW